MIFGSNASSSEICAVYWLAKVVLISEATRVLIFSSASDSNFLNVRREQPTAHSPGHAVTAIEDRGTHIQGTVQVHLLMGGGPVAAIGGGAAIQGHLHAGENLSRQGPAPDGIECQRRAGRHQGLGQIVHEGFGIAAADVLGALRLEQVLLLLGTHNIDQRDPILKTQPIQHLAQIGGGGRVHQRLVPLALHGADHAERG